MQPTTRLWGSENLGNSWQMQQKRIDQSTHEEHGGDEEEEEAKRSEDDGEGGSEEAGDKASSAWHGIE